VGASPPSKQKTPASPILVSSTIERIPAALGMSGRVSAISAEGSAVSFITETARPVNPDVRFGTMRAVIVESPFAGNFIQRWLNRRYARACLRDCLNRGEAPFASHLLYTQPGVLRDSDPIERTHGIAAGLSWGERADATVVYQDRGISAGMRAGIAAAEQRQRPVEYRSLQRWRHG